MGFRGEALASVAAIAQVELKTKRIGDETGTMVVVEGSEVKMQEACQCSEGTSISIKNLFFNVPARRNFLKSNNVELSHILDEFHRVALAFPDISFEMHHNNNEVFHLPPSPLKQRIINIFGANYNQRLLPVLLESSICNITGFIGKPEAAKKTKGDQFFFVNKRYIRHAYLNHAVSTAFAELLTEKAYPAYFIFIEIDPKEIDINIHPTKTEIKFQDDKSMYAIMKSATTQSLGKFSITPSIDFTIEKSFDVPPLRKGETVKQPTIKLNPDYNPFDKLRKETLEAPLTLQNKNNRENWEKLYSRHADNQLELPQLSPQEQPSQQIVQSGLDSETFQMSEKQYFQLHSSFIITSVKSGVMLINQQSAHERILFEHFSEILEKRESCPRQKQLFPQVLEFSPADAELMKEIAEDIKVLGFEIDEFGQGSFVVNSVPADDPDVNVKQIIEGLLENFKLSRSAMGQDKNTMIAKTMAKTMSLKRGKSLQQEEMRSLVDQLFACKLPHSSIEGKPTISIISLDVLERKFR